LPDQSASKGDEMNTHAVDLGLSDILISSWSFVLSRDWNVSFLARLADLRDTQTRA